MKVTVSNEERPDFLPFTLNMRLTSKESAHNLYELLRPIVYARLISKENQQVSVGINQEQRQMAEDICNVLSAQVNNIDII